MLISEAVERYLSDLALARAHKTVETYATGLNHLITFYDGKVTDLDIPMLANFARSLGKQGYSPASMHVYLVTLNRFLRWLVLEDLSSIDLLKAQERLSDFQMRIPERVPRTPKEGDVEQLFHFLRNYQPTFKEWNQKMCWLRNCALLETLRSTGCRISEALSLKVEHLENNHAVIQGKGNRTRHLFWDTIAHDALREYLDARGTDGYVFQHHGRAPSEKAISAERARNALKEMCWLARVEELTPHQFRHRFGTRVLETTHDLALTQDLMGHASPNTTRVYTNLSPDKLQNGFNGVDL